MSKTPSYTPDSDSDSDTTYSSEEDQSSVNSYDDDNLSIDSDPSSNASTSGTLSPAPEVNDAPPLRLIQPLFGDPNYLKSGDHVAMVLDGMWNTVVLMSNTGRKHLQNNSLYWNFKTLDGSLTTGSYLFPGQAWGVLRDDDKNVDLSRVEIVLPRNPP